MVRLILKLYWKLSGWKITGSFPHHLKKMVIAVAPHTSKEDVMVGFAARRELNIPHAKFLGKQELFKGPLGWVLRKLGGTPVDRFSKHGVVDQAAALFAGNEDFLLALAPEGTRKRVNGLRSGFYHIAKKAQVPILPVALDFKNKQVVVGEAFFTGNDEEADFKKIVAFFAEYEGKHPEKDLRHLKNL
ncbi:MAG: 1-acyl-sn-glycerol-3-phosphate acyltransferase [Ferruginibacter sp.]|nr:1-acyl-sn-glycerol-3-phosphate acyltransferase [Chitinophagaceae bacterium]MBP6286918.1 1-acyl-sn-glycerol-3-phosphate acyltransferase [Ferruginibacter sp.]MBU9935170.1 1-acyl-sn-glycerol-3-phosphate acyltransferase [Ferruginibacter sp.]